MPYPVCPCLSSTAPPDYSSVVTNEEAVQNAANTNNNSSCPEEDLSEDLSGILGRPLMAYVQEFRFRPPPVYCEVRFPHHLTDRFQLCSTHLAWLSFLLACKLLTVVHLIHFQKWDKGDDV